MSFLGTGFGGASGGYSITNSARFNGTSDYLSRTPGSNGNGSKWTLSWWAKEVAATGTVFEARVDANNRVLVGQRTGSAAGDICVSIRVAGSYYGFFSTPTYRDYSAHGHCVIIFDSSLATNTDRLQFWYNGVRQSVTVDTAYPSLNLATCVNQTTAVHKIANMVSTYWGGYLSDFYLIDGQALTPTSFGKTDSNGVWVPIKYAGTYGTNGFKLEFLSSGALGTDTSGNGNTWTVSGSPVQTTDTPTNNYGTLNPLDKDDGITSVTNGNLSVITAGSNGSIKATVPFPTGKWYFEVITTAVNSGGTQTIGIMPQSQPPTNNMSDAAKLGYALDVSNSARKFENGTATAYGTYTRANGQTYMVAFDQTSGKLWFGQGGTWLASGDPANGTNSTSSSISSATGYCAAGSDNTVSGTFAFNFGATAFAYTPPTGFKALCTANLTSTAVTTSGTFTGNANADGPFIWTNGNPATLTINGNAVTFGTHADKTAGGFKLRSSSASYNTSGSNTWTATAGKRFVYSATSINTAQGNP